MLVTTAFNSSWAKQEVIKLDCRDIVYQYHINPLEYPYILTFNRPYIEFPSPCLPIVHLHYMSPPVP